jgi:hypothetical protein
MAFGWHIVQKLFNISIQSKVTLKKKHKFKIPMLLYYLQNNHYLFIYFIYP